MRAQRLSALLLLGVVPVSACTEMSGVPDGEPQVVETSVEALDERSFAVSVTALNMDGYQLARCVAAGHVDALRDAEDEHIFEVFRHSGGRITDEFRIDEGVRTRTTAGIQTYALVEGAEVSDHDGRDVMAVDLQLAECEKAGMSTEAE